MRKTKIICTIGPATNSVAMLESLYNAGMNVVRLNMSHGDHEFHGSVIESVRKLNRKVKYPVAILLDTQGPEIRTGDLREEMLLREGETIKVCVDPAHNIEGSSLLINYDDLLDQVNIGDRITIDNGLINLHVLSKSAHYLDCRIDDGGTIKGRRHVNLPGIHVNLPAITEKDERDIVFGLEQGIDFIALSFVREMQDIEQLRKLLVAHNSHAKIIAKIEDQEGVRNIESIVDVADGVMVARGDLGVEIAVEMLPNVQRRIVQLCAERGKRVIVATHLLESMINNPIPTRAEVTDVANAVYEEADAIMLSGETTVGKYPVRSVEYLDKIARESERTRGMRFCENLNSADPKQPFGSATLSLAEAVKAKAIIAITRSGITANRVANCRPREMIVHAFTNSVSTFHQLALSRNVYAHRIQFYSEPEKTLGIAFKRLKEEEGFQSGDKVVVLSDILAGSGIDAIQVRSIP